METAVTLVTADAESAEELSDRDYREIYDELRSKMTLRVFVKFIKSQVSFAWWSKFERGEAKLDRERRAELRRIVGLAALPRAVTEVTAAVDPNARVWQVGNGQPDRVVLVGRELHEPVLLRLNGNLQVVAEAEGRDLGDDAAVTAVTGARRARTYKGLSVRRETWERLNSARLRAGLSWDEFLGRWEVGDVAG